MADPRVTWFTDVQVYAAHCGTCGTDEHTDWKDLPALAEMDRPNHATSPWYGFGRARAWCRRCESIIDLAYRDAWMAREPERLAARLAELQREAHEMGWRR
jgi:hypothetical protein